MKKQVFVSIHSLVYFFIKGEKNWLELLELADRAIDGLPFHQHLPIIKECVHICSYLYDKNHSSLSLILILSPLYIQYFYASLNSVWFFMTRWKFDQPSPLLQTESQKLLLKLLSHPSLPVKTETYKHTLNLVKVRASHLLYTVSV